MSTEVDEIIFGLANRFRSERERLGLTQKALADLLLTTSRTIISYENGDSPPKLDKLILFAAKGADVGYILSGRCSLGTLESDEAALLNNYRNSSDTNKSILRKVSAALEKQGDEDGEQCA